MLLQLAFQLTDACQPNACEDDVEFDDYVYASLSLHPCLRLLSSMSLFKSIVTKVTKSVTGM